VPIKHFASLEPFDPAYPHLVEVRFKQFPFLTDLITAVNGNEMFFPALINKEGIMEPITTILQCMEDDKPLDVSFHWHDKTGAITLAVELVNFKFTRTIDLLDFDYTISDQLKIITVQFGYDRLRKITTDNFERNNI
jgi:hypothetical protein